MQTQRMNQRDAGLIISGVWSGKIPANDDRIPEACEVMNIPLETLSHLKGEMKKVEKNHCRVEIMTPAGRRR